MFTLSKIFWLIFSPGNFLILLLVLAAVLLFCGWRRTGTLLVSLVAAVFVTVGVFPIGYKLSETLENRFPANPPLPARVDGIVVLGGTVIPTLTHARGQPALTDGSERLIEFIHLARRYPAARLVFSGGSGSLTDQELKETEVARAVLDRLGFDDSRVMYEGRSRNTHENALYSREMARPGPGETWVLVTSAMHMPRAMGAYRAAGWTDVVAYPVDYSTTGTGSFELGFGPVGGLTKLSAAAHEWAGLAAYRIMGRIDVLFPGPGKLPDN